MKYEYEYNLVDGHIIVRDGDRQLLFDTGAPSSVGDSSPFAFVGDSYLLQSSYMGISLESLSKSVGTPVNVLIGSDILNRYDMLIDPITQTITLTEDELPLTGSLLSLDNFVGIPIVDAIVEEESVRMFFDTGAKLSYLDPDITNSFRSAGTESDFYPGVGDFTTNVYDISIVLGGENIAFRFGNLPRILQMTLMMADTRGIIGTAILGSHQVAFAPRRSNLALQRIN